MIEWVALDNAPGRKRTGAHAFGMLKRFKWAVCTRCGLISLRNAATTAAQRAPCVWWDA